jgi:hypothetical protein
MFAYVSPTGSVVLLVAAITAGIAALINARHLNQLKHHEIEDKR